MLISSTPPVLDFAGESPTITKLKIIQNLIIIVVINCKTCFFNEEPILSITSKNLINCNFMIKNVSTDNKQRLIVYSKLYL